MLQARLGAPMEKYTFHAKPNDDPCIGLKNVAQKFKIK